MSSSNSSGTTPAAPPTGSSIASQLASRRTSPKTKYLIIYNAISAGLWATILWHVLTHAYPRPRPTDLYASTGTFARLTQTLALLEIVHALLGVVRAGVFTTGLQVASRVTLIWWIVEFYDVKSEPAYVSMLGAWSVTEVVRYCYFVVSLTGQVPGFLIWLRYNLFFVLYPLGISSEAYLVYKSIPSASKQDPLLPYVLWLILAIYVPGSYILYTHMMVQRRRVMRGKQRARD